MSTSTKTVLTKTPAKKPPMSNLSYDVLTVLQNKLEAVAAYESYLKDCHEAGDTECQKLVAELKADDERHVGLLRQELERMVRAGTFQ
jgi:bacterioferritin (cytochrome b1)